MSSALPVITTDVGGHSEIINNGSNGMLIQPKQVEPLYEKLLELLNNEKLRTDMGAVAREYIVKKWGDFEYNAKVIYDTITAR
jgi:glycosyltransferase involved in cell wall biosynthesis